MKRWRSTSFKVGLGAFFAIVLLGAGVGYALDVQLVPATAQRAVNGKVRVHIIATDVSDLISFGVEVGYNTCVLSVDSVNTNKNTDFSTGFVMDPDGDAGGTQYTDPVVAYAAETCGPEDTFAAGTVRMMGGRLIGASTDGLDAPVLLGWITFIAEEEGESDLTINLYNNTSTYANFVGLGGPPAPVYDSTIPGYPFSPDPAQRATICIRSQSEAREGDMNGNNIVLYDDYAMFSAAWGSSFGDANYNPACDLDGDGAITYIDYAMFSADFNQTVTPCP